MFAQMFVLRRPMKDYRSLFELLREAILREPVLLLGAATIPFVALRRWSRWSLLIGYLATSLLIATALDVQVGGNVNYFFEALFAFVPLAAFGALKMGGRSRVGAGTLFLSGLLLTYLTVPTVVSAYYSMRDGRRRTRNWNLHMVAIRGVFQGNHVLSTVPTATQMAPETVISEPYTLSYLDRLRLIDLQPLRKRILEHEFDIVVTSARADSWRGISHVPRGLRPTIAEAYQPFCKFEYWLIHLPRDSSRTDLPQKLTAIGCVPTIPGAYDNSW
jgi:hypothetical protein